MEIILKYFPSLSEQQQFTQLKSLYEKWNALINVISRKDIDDFYERHVLHSLAIAKYIQFCDGTQILDVGTGGGFPGIPLAIMFPNCQFTLVDSIGKKIKVVQKGKFKKTSKNVLPNGILYLKGGELTEELAPFPKAVLTDISSYYDEPFFETKKIVYLPF